jgi:type II secretory pathway pseudopilin PulG
VDENQTRMVAIGVIVVGVLIVGIFLKVVVGGSEEPTDQTATADVAKTQNTEAQSALTSALQAAQTYFSESSSYAGLNPTTAQSMEPSIRWTGGSPARVNVVSIDLAAPTEVVLSTKSTSGAAFCIAAGPTGTTKGSVDAAGATSVASCTGTWAMTA